MVKIVLRNGECRFRQDVDRSFASSCRPFTPHEAVGRSLSLLPSQGGGKDPFFPVPEGSGCFLLLFARPLLDPSFASVVADVARRVSLELLGVPGCRIVNHVF